MSLSHSVNSVPTVDSIVFDGTVMPSSIGATYIAYVGYYKDSIPMTFNGGGSIALDLLTAFDHSFTIGATRDQLTVGEGIGGGTDDVTVDLDNITYMNRSSFVGTDIATFRVNSDGTLNINGNAREYGNTDKLWDISINGGTVNVTGNLDWSVTGSDSKIDFTAIGGSFTATYGGDNVDIVAVNAGIGTRFINNSGGTLTAGWNNRRGISSRRHERPCINKWARQNPG